MKRQNGISKMKSINMGDDKKEFMMNVFAALAEFERTIIIERCQSGRAEAKRKGKKFGRPKGIPKDKIAACSSLYMSGLTIAAIHVYGKASEIIDRLGKATAKYDDWPCFLKIMRLKLTALIFVTTRPLPSKL